MVLLLLAACALYLVLGDLSEALTLSFAVFAIAAIELVQSRKTERALAALEDLTSPRARVVRAGQELRVPGREVVPGDLLLLSEGDRVAADADILTSEHLGVDESLLSGESIPVQKGPADPEPTQPKTELRQPGPSRGPERTRVFSGSLVVSGRAVARVVATGLNARIGQIGALLRSVETAESPLHVQVRRIVWIVAAAAGAVCLSVVLLIGLGRGSWMEGALAGIALAMSMLPEEFPVVLTVYLALGAWRLSKVGVLARRVSAVETLGAATVLCTDKTGTLTENRMSVVALWVDGERCDVARGQELAERFHALVEFGILASQRDPFDPMEVAFHHLGREALAGTEHLHADWQLVRGYPLAPELLAMSHVWARPDGGAWVVAAKGAPEAIVDLCHLPDPDRRRILHEVATLAARGLRVLGVARASFSGSSLPEHQHDFAFAFEGLVGLADPVRPSAPHAVKRCQNAGIRVIMITGDYTETGKSIGRIVGLPVDAERAVLTGAELAQLSPSALEERLGEAVVVARAIPEHKLLIVRALQQSGEVVAMTGDGVNDAPALKAAHIGVAMGGRGTDVAREAASLVVTDDDFSSIVAGVALGRRIYANLRKALGYVLAVHVPVAGLALVPAILGWPLVLVPVHIVFLELIIDPASSIAFEAEPDERDPMDAPPRDRSAPLFDRTLLVWTLLQGLSVMLASLAMLLWGRAEGASEGAQRALAFSALIGGNAALVVVNRSWSEPFWRPLGRRNAWSWAVVSAALAFLALALAWPPMRDLFRFALPSFGALFAAVALGLGSLAWFELLKAFWPAALSVPTKASRRGPLAAPAQ
jgi:Ca2+-transporting ATPase